MKKELTIVGLALSISLVLLGAGCATGKPAEPANENVNTNTNGAVNVNEAAKPAGEAAPEINQADLDKLRKEINKMEYEDLNALTR